MYIIYYLDTCFKAKIYEILCTIFYILFEFVLCCCLYLHVILRYLLHSADMTSVTMAPSFMVLGH